MSTEENGSAPAAAVPTGTDGSVAQAPSPAASPEAEKPLSRAEIESQLNQLQRRFQGHSDKTAAQLRAEVRSAIGEIKDLLDNQRLETLSPEEQLQARLKRLEEKKETQPAQANNQTTDTSAQAVQRVLSGLLEALGIKSDDPDLDWGKDAGEFDEGLKRFSSSVKKISTREAESMIAKIKKESDEAIAKLRQESGIDKVSTSEPSGMVKPKVYSTATDRWSSEFAEIDAAKGG